MPSQATSKNWLPLPSRRIFCRYVPTVSIQGPVHLLVGILKQDLQRDKSNQERWLGMPDSPRTFDKGRAAADLDYRC